jgi:hypothetical protein
MAPQSRRAMSPRPMQASSPNDGGDTSTSSSTSSSTSARSDAAASASRALALVDEAMDLLHRELFVSEAIARATGEEPEDETAVVARVVEALASGKTSSRSEGEEGGEGFAKSFEEREAENDDALLRGLASSASPEAAAAAAAAFGAPKQPKQLDEAFLVALGIAAAAATGEDKKEGEDDDKKPEQDPKAQEIARRLRLLREATVNRASASLPAELRALDAAARAGSAAERRAVVREALVGGGGAAKSSSKSSTSSSPSAPPPLKRVSPAAFYSASCQIIDDMEERQIVPDAALLARVVLCRDDALALQRNWNKSDDESDKDNKDNSSNNNTESAFADSPSEDADLRDAVSSHGAMLHLAGAEFASMLVSQCKSSEERRELVRKIMRRGDVLAWQGRKTDESAIPTLKKARAAPRPGRLFAALYATMDALAAKGDSERARALENARRDAVEVMEEIAYS